MRYFSHANQGEEIRTMAKKTLKGRVDFQVAEVPTAINQPNEFVTMKEDTFSIKVKDDEDKIVYQNDEEKYQYPTIDSLANYLRFKGAELSDDQIQFLGEALSAEKTKEPYSNLLEDLNGLLQAKAKQSAYSKVFNEHKPISEETITNSQARMVRDFVRQNPTVSAESAIEVLKQFVPSMKDYTIQMFNANKGRV
jgi:hypothetical protein